MRTTVDIPDRLYRRLKARAAHEGISVKALVLRGVERELEPAPARKGHRVKLPLVDGDRPGSLNLTNEQIYELIDFP